MPYIPGIGSPSDYRRMDSQYPISLFYCMECPAQAGRVARNHPDIIFSDGSIIICLGAEGNIDGLRLFAALENRFFLQRHIILVLHESTFLFRGAVNDNIDL